MKTNYVIIGLFAMITVKSQVGINTKNPKATLDVQRSLKSDIPDGFIPPRISADSLMMKEKFYGPDQNGAIVYVTSPAKSGKVSNKTKNLTSSGYFIFDSEYTNSDRTKGSWKKMFSDPDAFSAKGTSGISIDSKTNKIEGSNFQAVRFKNIIASVGEEFVSDNQYVVKEAGLYYVNYSIRFGEGLTVKIPTDAKVGVAISKTSSDNKVALLDNLIMGRLVTSEKETISLTQGNINHIYNLNAGDKLSFGVTAEDVNLSSLGKVSTDITVYKIR
ncbi:MAG: hypothetical protein DI529_09405 [Chryseobacterium sp.]|nr:MAG: hypothetical protein DI529_09405 [Chryseobacterium sp.]